MSSGLKFLYWNKIFLRRREKLLENSCVYLFLVLVGALAFYGQVIFYFLCNRKKWRIRKHEEAKKSERKKKQKEGSSLVPHPTTNLEEVIFIFFTLSIQSKYLATKHVETLLWY